MAQFYGGFDPVLNGLRNDRWYLRGSSNNVRVILNNFTVLDLEIFIQNQIL